MTPSIPVGTATKAGLTGAGSSFVLAVVAFAHGDHSTVVIAALATGLASLLGTMAGRYAQAGSFTGDVRGAFKLTLPTVATAAAKPAAVSFGHTEPEPDDEDLPGDSELPDTALIPASTPAHLAEADQGNAGQAHVPLVKADGGVA